ncbi:MAG: hypothetical protein ACPG7W_06090 [Paracoccaceae bacterium]
MVAVFLMAACTADGPVSAFQTGGLGGLVDRLSALGDAEQSEHPITELVLQDVQITAPMGYCFEGGARRGGRFAVIGSCQTVTDGAHGPNVPPGILTVFIGPPEPDFVIPTPQQIADNLGAPLLFQRKIGSASLAHLGTGGDAFLESSDTRHWRVVDTLGGHPVMLTLYAPPDGALASRGGTALLRELRGGLRVLND